MYKIDKLLKLDRKIFHTADLALAWGITNKNTLYTTIKRYVAKGILIPIHKGFYATVPPARLDPVVVGIGFLHTFAYLSCENVLAQHGVISQVPETITLVSSVSKKFTVGAWSFLSRRLKPEFLYNTAGMSTHPGGYTVASLSRAVADMRYFRSDYYIDNSKSIDQQAVQSIQKEVGYP